MTGTLVIGVDMGTTATKAVAFTPDGAEVAQASVGYPLAEPHPGHAVQDPHRILQAVTDAIREVSGAVGADAVAALSFSTAMHSLLALDADREPLTPVLTWADTRASAQAERLRASADGLALHRRTGTPLHPMSPLTKLIWFREQEPDIRRRAAFWVGHKDWVLDRLCGRLVVDHSLASGSGLLDIHRLEWDDEALALAGIRESQLPTLVPTRHVLPGLLPDAAAATGLPADTPVVVGAGDGPLANLGVGAVRPGVAACSIGTSGALRVAVDSPGVDPGGGVFCYAITEERWVIGGAINNGGVTLDWVRAQIAEDPDTPTADLLDRAAGVPAGSGGLLMLPYLLSERAPHWSSLAKGAYVGLTRAHRREHLVRAAVEGVCLQLALVLRSMRAAGHDVAQVRATGGVMRHPLWRRTLANAFGMPISLLAGQQGSGFGAALLGMDALGLVDSIDRAADVLPVSDTVAPVVAEAAVYEALLPVFDETYDALLGTHQRLRRMAAYLPLS